MDSVSVSQGEVDVHVVIVKITTGATQLTNVMVCMCAFIDDVNYLRACHCYGFVILMLLIDPIRIIYLIRILLNL